MQTGWLDDGDARYYLQPSGRVFKAEGPAEIEGVSYLFAKGNYVEKNASVMRNGRHYVTDEYGRIISDVDQLTYLNSYRRSAGLSDLQRDMKLNEAAEAACRTEGEPDAAEVHSLAEAITGRELHHVAFITSTGFLDNGYVYLTQDAVDVICNPWFTEAGYCEQDDGIMIILAE